MGTSRGARHLLGSTARFPRPPRWTPRMTRPHRFGGPWTQEKLDRLAKYLSAYTTIFTKNERAQWFTTTYVDAFAGTGFRALRTGDTERRLFDDPDAEEFQKGSAAIALDVEPPFDRYIFVDQNPEYIRDLGDLRKKYRSRRIEVHESDANQFLANWCRQTNWKHNRAVVFLDPYGMQVEWSTIESIGATKAIDLWLLFPLGQAVNRMLTKTEPDPSWARSLTRFFGTDLWKQEFYRSIGQGRLFDDGTGVERTANFVSIGDFFVRRLRTAFAGVAEKPLPLTNSKHIPIYLLCFASANPGKANLALKIANHILGS